MIGIVIATHGELAAGLVEAAGEIMGPIDDVEIVNSTAPGVHPQAALRQALEKVNKGDGILALTDLFGGSPANMLIALSQEFQLEVVTGVNLPMVLRAVSSRQKRTVHELASDVAQYGIKQIIVANQLLAAKVV